MEAVHRPFDLPGLAAQPQSSSLEHYFTRDGSVEMENQIRRICQSVMVGIRKIIPNRRLQAVLLGGGYGRGEGGVFHAPNGDVLYNDLEFYVFVSGPTFITEKQYGAALHELGKNLGLEAGIDVDFKILSLRKFRRAEVSMFYYDLAVGHKWLYGQEELFRGCEHHRNAGEIPLSEGTRLLMNRCTGLLLIKDRARQGSLTPEFAERNLAKLQLALGDAILTAFGRYHSSCLERGQRVAQMQTISDFGPLADVQRHHAEGVEFKLHPKRTALNEKEIQTRFDELSKLALLVWLWLEQRRLGQHFASARDYAMNPINKYPKTKPWRNWLVSVLRLGPEMIWKAEALRYPRERLFNTLPLLLWERISENDIPLFDHLQGQLAAYVTTPQGFVPAYTKLWEQFR